MTIAHRFFIPHSKDLHGSQHRRPLTVMACTSPEAATSARRPAASPSTATSPRRSAPATPSRRPPSAGAISLSADGPDQRFPLILSPERGLRHLLRRGAARAGRRSPGVGGRLRRRLRRQGQEHPRLLRADAGRLNARLAAPERAKLDQYLESLRALERQIATRGTAQTSCKKPPRRRTPGGLLRTDRHHRCDQAIEQLVDITFDDAPVRPDPRQPHLLRGDGAARTSNTTGCSDPRNHHDDNHANDIAILQKIETWWFSMIARLANQLAKAPEGNGTMLDNSLIMMVNTGRRPPPPRLRQAPADPAGRAGRLGRPLPATTPRASTA